MSKEEAKPFRDDLAKIYRKIRADDPAIARLLFRRARYCETDLRKQYQNYLPA